MSEYCKNCYELAEQLYRYKQAIEKIQNIAITHDMPSCLKNDCNCESCKDKITEHGQKCIRNGLRKIIQKCEEAK